MSLERGKFQNLFELLDAEIMILVDKLFDYFFSEKFVEEGQTFISGSEYREAIEAKIEGDPMADILSHSGPFCHNMLPAQIITSICH